MMEAFEADVQLLPQWVQYWMDFLGAVLILSPLILLTGKKTRIPGLIMLASTLLVIPTMLWLHGQMGMVRLLGIVHVVVWTPLVIYLWKRVRNDPPGRFYTAILWIVIATLTVALAFDYTDVLRWLMGERAPIVEARG